MTQLLEAVAQVREAQSQTRKPLAIIVAGHNGSGKSTMWRRDLSFREFLLEPPVAPGILA